MTVAQHKHTHKHTKVRVGDSQNDTDFNGFVMYDIAINGVTTATSSLVSRCRFVGFFVSRFLHLVFAERGL